MSDENDTNRLTEDDGSLVGDALLHAVHRETLGLFKALDQKVETLDAKVGTLDAKVETLDAKVEARLRDTTLMWEVVVSRLDTIVAELETHGRRLDAIEGEIRLLRSRNERMIGQLSHDVVDVRAAQHDLEDRVEKLEKTPG